MEIDIRVNTSPEIDTIRLASADEGWFIAEVIIKRHNSVFIKDTSSYDEETENYAEPLRISDKQHALDVIKGINKAIELGWLK